MRMKLELVPIPVTDIDRSKDFYAHAIGFAVDVEITPADGVRIVQLTPPGSACSAASPCNGSWSATARRSRAG